MEGEPETRTLESVCPDCGSDVMHWIHFAKAGIHRIVMLLNILIIGSNYEKIQVQ